MGVMFLSHKQGIWRLIGGKLVGKGGITRMGLWNRDWGLGKRGGGTSRDCHGWGQPAWVAGRV
jgi:hypothetical protein